MKSELMMETVKFEPLAVSYMSVESNLALA
jgi:hypothetical protein